MKKLTLWMAIIIIVAVGFFLNRAYTATPTCDYYAGPTASGSGNGSSASNRFQISGFWALGEATIRSKVLCLTDGIYVGANSMITPPGGLGGISGSTITIKALNDGAVRIDGQNVRRPLGLFSGNNFFVIEGINVCCADFPISSPFFIGSNANNNTFRRIVVWDGYRGDGSNAGVGNVVLVQNYANTGNVFEDIAGFGYFTKGFESLSTFSVTVRRGFFMFTDTSDNAPRYALTMEYGGVNSIFENVIAVWHQGALTNCFLGPDGCGIFGNDGARYPPATDNNDCLNLNVLGSIVIADNDPGLIQFGGSSGAGGALEGTAADCMTFRDIVSYTPFSSIRPWYLASFSGTPKFQLATNLTGIGPNPGITTTKWTQTNVRNYSTLTAMNNATANPFQSSGTIGARVCYRYQDATLTSTQLWPWPMDSRITAAITVSGRNPTTYLGPGGTVTSKVEGLFGPIPPACRTDVVIPPSGPNLVLALSGDNEVIDRSGKNNNGTLIGGATYATGGKYNQAFSFNGTSQSLDIADSPSLALPNGFTMEAWIRPAATLTTWSSLFHKNPDIYGMYASIGAAYCGAGNPAGHFTSGGSPQVICYSTAFAPTTWAHAAVTYDGSTLRFYKDGINVTNQAATGVVDSSSGILQIGASHWGEFFSGLIDDIRIYDGAIPPTSGANTCVSAPSIARDMNCPILPVTGSPAAASGFKVGGAGGVKLGVGGSTRVGN